MLAAELRAFPSAAPPRAPLGTRHPQQQTACCNPLQPPPSQSCPGGAGVGAGAERAPAVPHTQTLTALLRAGGLRPKPGVGSWTPVSHCHPVSRAPPATRSPAGWGAMPGGQVGASMWRPLPARPPARWGRLLQPGTRPAPDHFPEAKAANKPPPCQGASMQLLQPLTLPCPAQERWRLPAGPPPPGLAQAQPHGPWRSARGRGRPRPPAPESSGLPRAGPRG